MRFKAEIPSLVYVICCMFAAPGYVWAQANTTTPECPHSGPLSCTFYANTGPDRSCVVTKKLPVGAKCTVTGRVRGTPGTCDAVGYCEQKAPAACPPGCVPAPSSEVEKERRDSNQ